MRTIIHRVIDPTSMDTNEISGAPIHDTNGNPMDYDIRAQTRAVIEEIKVVAKMLREIGLVTAASIAATASLFPIRARPTDFIFGGFPDVSHSDCEG